MTAAEAIPALSVVVIGRNEGERLVRCIRSVRAMRQPGGEVELIYVDSASTDGSPERAAELGARVIALDPERPCAAVGRNAGLRQARAATVLFLDGDTILAPDFVADSLPEFEDEKVAIVWGHRREIHTEASLFNRVLDLDWVYPPGRAEFCGGDALMRRSALEEVGGYDDTLIAGEEPEMCRRMRERGYVILHVDRPMTGHDLSMPRWRQYWRRAVRAGYAYAQVSERFAGSDMPLWRREARRNRVHAAALVCVPALAAALSVALWTWIPAAAALAALALLAVRSAFRSRWKGGGARTLLLYGIHSHLQQIPILWGQIRFRLDRRAGRVRGLIEYKGEA